MNDPTHQISLFDKLHRNERGGLSIETILLIGAIALPILIFIIKFGWPRIKDYFNTGIKDLEAGGDNVKQGN